MRVSRDGEASWRKLKMFFLFFCFANLRQNPSKIFAWCFQQLLTELFRKFVESFLEEKSLDHPVGDLEEIFFIGKG
jgi:hypothetical protein